MRQYVTTEGSRVVLITEHDGGFVEYASRVDTETGVIAYNALAWMKEPELFAVLKTAMNESTKVTDVELEYYWKQEKALDACIAFVAHSKKMIGA
jgi:hypothetical protein